MAHTVFSSRVLMVVQSCCAKIPVIPRPLRLRHIPDAFPVILRNFGMKAEPEVVVDIKKVFAAIVCFNHSEMCVLHASINFVTTGEVSYCLLAYFRHILTVKTLTNLLAHIAVS